MAQMNSAAVQPRLSMRGICKKFGATVALDGVNLSIGAGEIHALVGENGAGKSTLMKILSGALSADAGTMELDGEPFIPATTRDARKAGVAMIYQELSLVPHLSVAENVVLGLEPHHLGFIRRSALVNRTREALAQLGHDDIPLHGKVGLLPLATRQVVEIARALTTGCRVLVLDEPTSSLSEKDIAKLFVTIRRLSSEGTTVVYISHILEEVKQISDRFTVLRDGRSVGTGATAETTPEAIVRLMVGRRIDQMYPRSGHSIGEPLLEIRDLAGRAKPRSVSFTLHRGEVLGIAGLVGAGRTELLRVLFGLDPIRNGAIKIGMVSGYAAPSARWAQSVGMVSEDRNREGLALRLSIVDNMMMNLSRDTRRLGLIRPGLLQRKAGDFIELLGIRSTGPLQRVESLSGGNQQKVALARLLHQNVDVVLLDEPTRGIDVSSKSSLYALIDRMAVGDQAKGVRPKAVLIVSSYLPELIGMCDRIAVMCRGVLGTPRPVSEVDQHSIMAEATGQGIVV